MDYRRIEMKKVIDTENGNQIVITSNCKWIELDYQVSEWSNGEMIPCFKSYGDIYFLDEFMRLSEYCQEWEKEFDGVMGTSYFSGIYLKLNDSCDAVQVYYMRQ
jgi:hypothetical protein